MSTSTVDSKTAALSSPRINFLVVRQTEGRTEIFPVAESVLLLLRTIYIYLECGRALPGIGNELLNKLVEVVRSFHSLTCQLLLGAGARQFAGLRSITATHLAIGSRCLALILSQIPVVRECFVELLPGKQTILLSALDRVYDDITFHHEEVLGKLVAIIGEITDTCCRQLKDSTWLTNPALEQHASKDEPDPCVRTLIKQASTLNRSLSNLLPIEERDMVFGRVGEVITERFVRWLGTLEPHQRRAAHTRLVTNVSYVQSKVRSLKGVPAHACQGLDAFLKSDPKSSPTSSSSFTFSSFHLPSFSSSVLSTSTTTTSTASIATLANSSASAVPDDVSHITNNSSGSDNSIPSNGVHNELEGRDSTSGTGAKPPERRGSLSSISTAASFSLSSIRQLVPAIPSAPANNPASNNTTSSLPTALPISSFSAKFSTLSSAMATMVSSRSLGPASSITTHATTTSTSASTT